MNNFFNKVLFVGPDIKGKGGISSVLCSYRKMLTPFHYISSNSRYGTIVGIYMLIKLMICLPYYVFFKGIKIVHIHGASGKSFVRKALIVNWCKMLGLRVVFHLHGGAFDKYVNQCGVAKIKKTFDRCDELVALTRGWEKYLECNFGKKVYVINNPIEKANNIKRDNDGAIDALFLGLICENKGIYDLLNVVAKNKTYLDGKFILHIGGNGEVDKLNHFIKFHEIGNIVKYEGWVGGEKKIKLLQNCNLYILPSYIEGLPISILEAMSYSMAVISTNIGGIPEIVENGANGIVHEPGDKEAIYNAIKLFIDNPQLIKEYGIEGLKKVESYYPDVVKTQLENLYNQLLNK